MYIEVVPNRRSRPAVLLREGWREGTKVCKRTLANLSDWEPQRVEALGAVLKGQSVVGDIESAFEIVRSRPHGHVSAVLGTLTRLKLDQLVARSRSRARDLCVAMIVARLLSPGSKLAVTRGLSAETAESTLGELLGVDDADEDECYAAMDWLLERQGAIEDALAKRHLEDGALVLYDVTSTYFEGHTCPLAKLGHSRDGKKDTLQIVIGLLTNGEGCPVAVEVFDGNTGDPKTVASQVRTLQPRFGLKRVILVGDRGLITDARIREDLSTVEGLDWITALRAPAIAALVEAESLQLSFFDERDLAEISAPAYPGERLVVCKNPLLAKERGRKRSELLAATERHLDVVAKAVARATRPLRGQAQIGLRVGKVMGRFKMAKHFKLTITDDGFHHERDQEAIRAETSLDGLYVIRTTVGSERLTPEQVVHSYKRLAHVARAFRSLKTVDLHIRPIHHRKAARVRAHVLLCMLSYYLEWHMRRALAPILFDDDDKPAGEARRASVVAPAQRSSRAEAKAATKRTSNGDSLHSFTTLLRDLATVVKNRVQPRALGAAPFDLVTRPTPNQKRAFDLLSVTCSQ
ncbi:MAG: IS1634 family transposase [Nitrospirae bacterium]|nr:IS1634 family transposase [Nitrospirota bacterium]